MAPGSTEAALQARIRQQAIVAEVGRRALAGEEPDALLAHALGAAVDALGAAVGKVVQIDGSTAVTRALVGLEASPGDHAAPIGPDSQERYVAAAGEPVLIHDLRTEQRFTPNPLLQKAGAVSGISAPIGGPRSAWGVFGVHDTQRRSFSEDDVHFVHAIANTLADAQARHLAESRLRESEARSRAVLDTTVDAIITIDVRGAIESFNRAAERIFGYSSGEVIGKNVSVLMPEPYYSEHDDYLSSYRETGRRKIIGIGREVTGRRKDGSTFPMDLAVSEVDLGGRVIFTGIVRDISERRRLELEVLRISDEERRRIGQDLHDDLGQQLTGVGLIARSMARRLHKEEHPEATTADDITRMIKQADEQARRLARGLVPVQLGADGLASALARLAANAEELFGITCTVELRAEDQERMRDDEVVTHLYRIAQEAVSNAVRHGQADRVNILVTSTNERLRLWIHDNGSGIPDAIVRGESGTGEGMGLQIMHYRARIIGGSLDVRPDPGGGTVVVFTQPPSSDSPADRGEARPRAHTSK